MQVIQWLSAPNRELVSYVQIPAELVTFTLIQFKDIYTFFLTRAMVLKNGKVGSLIMVGNQSIQVHIYTYIQGWYLTGLHHFMQIGCRTICGIIVKYSFPLFNMFFHAVGVQLQQGSCPQLPGDPSEKELAPKILHPISVSIYI